MPYADVSPAETLEQALELLDYDDFRRQQAAARHDGRYLGVGTCCYIEPTTPGHSNYASEGATIRIDPSGRVAVYVAGGSTGNSLETTVVQLTADALGVPIDHVSTIQGDTALTPYGAGTGGSRSGSMLAGAVSATAAVLRQKLVAIAAHRLEAAADDIELVDGRAFVRGTPTAGVSRDRAGRDRLLPFRRAAPRRDVGAGGDRALHRSVTDAAVGQRHPRLHVRGRHRHRPGHAAALHRERGLRPHDQPGDRRGSDRRRHGAGHRRGAARGARLRRRRQPPRHDVHGLPPPDHGRRRRPSSTATW